MRQSRPFFSLHGTGGTHGVGCAVDLARALVDVWQDHQRSTSPEARERQTFDGGVVVGEEGAVDESRSKRRLADAPGWNRSG